MPEPNYKDIPGEVKVVIQPFQEGDARFEVRDPQGNVVKPGYRLADLKQKYGETWTIRDPFRGDPHDISLASFGGLDPETTFLQCRYEFHPTREYVLAHPDVFPPGPGIPGNA